MSFGAVRGDELSAIDVRLEVEDLRVDAESAFGEQEVAENDPGNLEAVGEIEDFGNEGEAVADVERGGDDSWVVAEGCAEHLPEVALFCLGRHAGGRACALAVDDDEGNLCLGGEAEAFAHE